MTRRVCVCVCVFATNRGTQGVGPELARPEAAGLLAQPRMANLAPLDQRVRWRTAPNSPGKAIRNHKRKGPPTASPSHPPRGHQGTHTHTQGGTPQSPQKCTG